MKLSAIVAAIGVGLGLLSGYNIAYVSRQHRAQAIRAQMDEARATQDVRAQLATVLRQIEQYRKRLPESPDSSWLVHEVVPLAAQAGVQVTSIAQDIPQEFPSFTRLAINVDCVASYHQLGVLLDALERSPRYLRVDRIDMGRVLDGEERGTVRLSISTVHMPPLDPAAAPSSG